MSSDSKLMLEPNSEIYRLKQKDSKAAAKILTEAFYDDPLLEYVCQDEPRRHQKTFYIIKTVLSLGINYGEVWGIGKPSISGAAIWMPPDFSGITFFRSLRTGIFLEKLVLGSSASKRYSLFNSIADELHSEITATPHWYLFVIGISPDYQGRGLGTKLIKHMLSRTDEENYPVFLTAPKPENIGYYEKLGFSVMGVANVPNSNLSIPGLMRNPWGENY